MDMRGSLLACDKFSDVRAFFPLFSVLVSRQDLFYLNYNEGKRVSETGLWQIMKWGQKGELNLEYVQKSQANIVCSAS